MDLVTKKSISKMTYKIILDNMNLAMDPMTSNLSFINNSVANHLVGILLIKLPMDCKISKVQV